MQKILIPLFIIYQHDTNYANRNSNTVSFHLGRRSIDEIISRIVFDTLTFITCYSRGEGKNVWRRDETGRVDVKVVICLGLAIKQGNGRAVTFVLESADTLHGRLSPPGKASWSTQLCVTQGPINRTCIARSGPLAFFFFSSCSSHKTSGTGRWDATMNITVTFTFF